MHDVVMPGLFPQHPAAALAVLGLYRLVPGCRLRYANLGGQQYGAVLTSGLKTLEDVAGHLGRPEVWRPFLEVPQGDEQTQLTPGELAQVAAHDCWYATSYYGLLRSGGEASRGRFVAGGNRNKSDLYVWRKVIGLTRAQDILPTLRSYREWVFDKDDSASVYGLFPEARPAWFDNKWYEANVKSPLVAALAMAGLTLLPTYVWAGRDATACVVRRRMYGEECDSDYLLLPVWTVPLSRAACSALLAGEAWAKPYNAGRWKRLGVAQVYAYRRHDYGNFKGVFWGEALKRKA